MKCSNCDFIMKKQIINKDTIYFCSICGNEEYVGPKDILDLSNIKTVIIKEDTKIKEIKF